MADVRTLNYWHEGVALKGVLAVPDGPGPHPGLLVMHNARGLGPGVIRRAEALADRGYVALAADMYGDGAFFSDPNDAGPSMGALLQQPGLMRSRIVSTFETLRTLPSVDEARTGAVGFCFGGMCVLELARSGAPARAVVSFHGLLKTDLPARRGAVDAKVLTLTGALDPYASATDLAAFREEMTAADVDHHVTIYSNGWHAFSDDDAPEMGHVPGVRFDPLIDRLAWAQAVAFLDAVVRD